MKNLNKGLTKLMLAGTVDELGPGPNEFTTYFKDPKNPDGPKIPKRFPLRFPYLASEKIDGIRCGVHRPACDDMVLSRHLKTIPNNYVRFNLACAGTHGLDGELMIGAINAVQEFGVVTSGIMSKDGNPDFSFNVFDSFHPAIIDRPFRIRTEFAQRQVVGLELPHIKYLEHTLIKNLDELVEFEQRCYESNFEGAMLRTADGPYKQGRSTETEGFLLKLKRFVEGEARIIGFNELMRNENEAFIDERGFQKRSSSKEGKVPAGMLGSFWVRDLETNVEFKVVGGTEKFKRHVWENKPLFENEILTYKYQPHGMKDKPRIGTFKAMRPKGSY